MYVHTSVCILGIMEILFWIENNAINNSFRCPQKIEGRFLGSYEARNRLKYNVTHLNSIGAWIELKCIDNNYVYCMYIHIFMFVCLYVFTLSKRTRGLKLFFFMPNSHSADHLKLRSIRIYCLNDLDSCSIKLHKQN